MTSLWSTANIHPSDRIAWWVDELSANCQVDCEPQRGVPFFGEGSVADIAAGLQIGMSATSTPHGGGT